MEKVPVIVAIIIKAGHNFLKTNLKIQKKYNIGSKKQITKIHEI